MNSTTNYFWGKICFMDFASIVLCMTSLSCLSVCLFVCLFVCRISQKVVDRFGWNLVARLGVGQCRIDEIFMNIRVQIWTTTIFLKWFFNIERWGYKLHKHIYLYICILYIYVGQSLWVSFHLPGSYAKSLQ